jgi:PPOX class probable F420-dependent enzyme
MELSPSVRAFLEEPRFATLATINRDGTPQQTVMWYALRGDTIMMNTARGRKKDRNLARDDRASFCVEAGERYVVIEGSISMNDDPEIAQADITALAVRYHSPEEAEEMSREHYSKQQRVTLLMTPEKIYTQGV